MGTTRPRLALRLLALLVGGAVAASVLLIISAPQAQALIVYRVSPSGDDSADGVNRPWRTIQKATDTAPAGAYIQVEAGTYAPFTITRPSQTVTGVDRKKVVVRGRLEAQDVIRIAAPGVTLTNLTVTGCIPNPTPPGDFGDEGSSAIRINDDANNVTVRKVTIRKSQGTNRDGLAFGCYGVLVHDADGSKILDNDISGTGTAVYFNEGGKGAKIEKNRIHDNTVLIRNTPGGDDDYGATGIVFANVQARPGATATKNTIINNSGHSSDYEFDGGAFEIYNTSYVRMVKNTISNNENVLETGTSPDGDSTHDCVRNIFADNKVRGRTPGSKLERSVGMILRCATAMAIENNTFEELDWYIYDISADGAFASDVDGLKIQQNTINQFQKVYHLGVDPVAAHLVIKSNRIRFKGEVFASYGDGSTSPTLEGWQNRSGQDRLSSMI